ncbi:MAG: AMP-binding protein, partial [Rickettsiales bacterium]|nr:AMP-binding protein [Rickettsiales bacterium]
MSVQTDNLQNFLKEKFKKEGPFCGKKNVETGEFEWSTYQYIGHRTKQLAHFFYNFMASIPSSVGCIGISSSTNREDWLIADFAACFCGITTVGYHHLWPEDEQILIINSTNTQILVVDKDLVDGFLNLKDKCPCLKIILCMDLVQETDFVKSLVNIFESAPEFEGDPFPNEAYSIIHSSGTSGKPKGLVFTAKRCILDSKEEVFSKIKQYTAVSWSPLAHGMDRGIIWQVLCAGGRVAFISDKAPELFEDCRKVNPGMVMSFPQLWNDLYIEFKKTLKQMFDDYVVVPPNPPNLKISQALYAAALQNVKDAPLLNEIRIEAYKKYRGILGNSVRVVATGGAYTSPEVMTFLQRVFPEAMVINAYGTTEVAGISSNGHINTDRVDVKLVDAPELGFLTTDKPYPRGEIVCRTKTAMVCEYFGNSENAKEATKNNFRDGWYYTGDIGCIKENNMLEILDRRANIAELYLNHRSVWVMTEKVENLFQQCGLFKRIFLYNDRNEEFLIAVVEEGATKDKNEILLEIRIIAHKNELKLEEVPRGVVISPFQWTMSSGMLSPLLKLKRGILSEKHKNIVDAVFGNIRRTREEREEKKKISFFDSVDYDFEKVQFLCDDFNDSFNLNHEYEENIIPLIKDIALLMEKSNFSWEIELKKRIEETKKQYDEERRESGGGGDNTVKVFIEKKTLLEKKYK